MNKRKLKFTSHASRLMYAHLKLTLSDEDRAYSCMLQIHNWMSSNGPEWTVDRLKSLKTWFIQHLAGNVDYHEPWFKKQEVQDGQIIPTGTFKFLFEDVLYSKHRHSKKIIKALSALMVYTGIRLEKPSAKQIIKTIGSIQGPVLDANRVDTLVSDGHKLGSLLSQDQLHVVEQYLRKRSKGFLFTPVSLNTGKPFVQGGEKYLTSFAQGCHVPMVNAYLSEFFRDFPKVEFPQAKLEDLPPTKDSIGRLPLSGSIIIIQEPGAKARVVANPSSASQVALYPLHNMLDQILNLQVTDCTHDQESGAIWAQEMLCQGNTVYSVDLSGATDNFPISLQLALLESLGLKAEADLLKQLATGIWMLHPDLHTNLVNGGDQIATTYTKGQPQGLYSSFPLFGLTHNLICTRLCSKLGLVPVDSFRVLGDDIVMINEDLHNLYRKFMRSVKVPISESKSLQSDSLAEFAGYIITSSGHFKPAKVPKPDTDKPYEHSFYNYLRVVGTEGVRFLPSKVRNIAMKVAMLPEELGGLGLNPYGLSYEDRTNGFLERSNGEDVIPSYYSLQGNFSALQYSKIPEYAEPVMDWLHDQWSLYDDHAQQIVQTIPRLATMVESGISEVHSLAFQLSSFYGCADGRTLIGNKADKDASSKPYKTDFEVWKDQFEASETVYPLTTNSSLKRSHTIKPSM